MFANWGKADLVRAPLNKPDFEYRAEVPKMMAPSRGIGAAAFDHLVGAGEGKYSRTFASS
jgi:hypothetical protein